MTDTWHHIAAEVTLCALVEAITGEELDRHARPLPAAAA